jgi:pyruvate/2-oxoglutarate dehydrogenase complex dihydrolipoamide acyltransferase (E2) component
VVGSRRDVARRFSPLAALMSLPFNAAIIALVAGVAILTLSEGELPQSPVAGPEPAPVVRAEHAAVAVERVPLTTPDRGIVITWDKAPGESVGEGAPLLTVVNEAEGGIRTVVTSPCACVLARRLAGTGDRVREGEEVALLYPQDSEGHVQALFPEGRAPEAGTAVSVRLPYSGESYDGVVETVGAAEDPEGFIGLPAAILEGGDSTVFARISTSPPVPAALAGDPAIVTIEPDA